MPGIIEQIRSNATLQCRSVVLPEAQDERILRAAIEVKSAGLASPVLLGSPDEIQSRADAFGLDCKALNWLIAAFWLSLLISRITCNRASDTQNCPERSVSWRCKIP